MYFFCQKKKPKKRGGYNAVFRQNLVLKPCVFRIKFKTKSYRGRIYYRIVYSLRSLNSFEGNSQTVVPLYREKSWRFVVRGQRSKATVSFFPYRGQLIGCSIKIMELVCYYSRNLDCQQNNHTIFSNF